MHRLAVLEVRVLGPSVVLSLLLTAALAPPVVAQTFDETQLATIREIVTQQGYGEPTESEFKSDVGGLRCRPTSRSKTFEHKFFVEDPAPDGPGSVNTIEVVVAYSQEGAGCGRAFAETVLDHALRLPVLVETDPPEAFTMAGHPAAALIDPGISQDPYEVGGQEYARASSVAVMGCGDVVVRLSQERVAAAPDTTTATRDGLARAARTDIRAKLVALGGALADAGVCGPGQAAASPGESPTRSASPTPGGGASASPAPFTVVLGCAHDEEPAAPGMVRCTADVTGEAPGADLADITFEWSWDGVVDRRTNEKTYSRPDAEIAPGTHTIRVVAIDGRSKARSRGESWTFTMAGSPGATAGPVTGGGTGRPSVPPTAAPSAPASASPAGFTLTVGCVYRSDENRISCLAAPHGAPPGTKLVYEWTQDGAPRPDITVERLLVDVPGRKRSETHTFSVRARDPASGAWSPLVSTTIEIHRYGPVDPYAPWWPFGL
jgi:hypothetical protein